MRTPSPMLAHGRLSLSCEIDPDGFKLIHPTPTVKWFGPDQTTYPGTATRNKYTLEVDNVSGIHSGKWICEVKYSRGNTLRAMTEVIIVGKCTVNGTQHHHFSRGSILYCIIYFHLRQLKH